jgi:hypothetical protein
MGMGIGEVESARMVTIVCLLPVLRDARARSLTAHRLRAVPCGPQLITPRALLPSTLRGSRQVCTSNSKPSHQRLAVVRYNTFLFPLSIHHVSLLVDVHQHIASAQKTFANDYSTRIGDSCLYRHACSVNRRLPLILFSPTNTVHPKSWLAMGWRIKSGT